MLVNIAFFLAGIGTGMGALLAYALAKVDDEKFKIENVRRWE